MMPEAFWSIWWVWLAGALALAILELLLPGSILLGFAIGAGATGLMLLIPGLSPSLSVVLAVFAVSSLVAWLGLRRYFAFPKGQVKTFDEDIND